MRNSAKRSDRFVVCIDNTGCPASLELHKIYRVVPDADARVDGDLRIIDESGEDYLYPASCFSPINLPPSVKKSLLRPGHRLAPAGR